MRDWFPQELRNIGPQKIRRSSQHKSWTRLLTRRFLSEVQTVASGSTDSMMSIRWPSTQLFKTAAKTFEDWESLRVGEQPPFSDIIGCHVTNYGSGPDYDELRIPKAMLEFWSEARSQPLYRDIEREAWDHIESKKANRKKSSNPEFERRNRLFEELGQAFKSEDYRARAKLVCKHFFISVKKDLIRPGLFTLAGLFLQKVANMNQKRLDAIQKLGDKIADSSVNQPILDRLFKRSRTSAFVECLTYAQDRMSRAKESPIPTPMIHLALDVVSEDDATARDMWLVRELLLMRIMERLAEKNPELLSSLPDPTMPDEIAKEN